MFCVFLQRGVGGHLITAWMWSLVSLRGREGRLNWNFTSSSKLEVACLRGNPSTAGVKVPLLSGTTVPSCFKHMTRLCRAVNMQRTSVGACQMLSVLIVLLQFGFNARKKCLLNTGFSVKPKTRTMEIFITQSDFAYVMQKPAERLTFFLLLYYFYTSAHFK